MTYKDFIDQVHDYAYSHGDFDIVDALPAVIFTDRVSTMATNSKNIFVNPTWVDKLTIPQIVGVLVHEFLHDVYGHHSAPWAVYDRNSGLSPDEWHNLTNVAEDIVINDAVVAFGEELPEEGTFRKDSNIPDDLKTSHEIFVYLKNLYTEEKRKSSELFQAIKQVMQQMEQQEQDDQAVADMPLMQPDDSGQGVPMPSSSGDEGDENQSRSSSSSTSSSSSSKPSKDSQSDSSDSGGQEGQQSAEKTELQRQMEQIKMALDKLNQREQDLKQQIDDAQKGTEGASSSDQDDDSGDSTDSSSKGDSPSGTDGDSVSSEGSSGDDADSQSGSDGSSQDGDAGDANGSDEPGGTGSDDRDELSSQLDDVQQEKKTLEDRLKELAQQSALLDETKDDISDSDFSGNGSDEDDGDAEGITVGNTRSKSGDAENDTDDTADADNTDKSSDDSSKQGENTENEPEDGVDDSVAGKGDSDAKSGTYDSVTSLEKGDPSKNREIKLPNLSRIASSIAQQIGSPLKEKLTQTKRAENPGFSFVPPKQSWVEKALTFAAGAILSDERERTFARPGRRPGMTAPSGLVTPSKGYRMTHPLPKAQFYIDCSGSMGDLPEVIRQELYRNKSILGKTQSTVVPFTTRIYQPVDISMELPYLGGGTDIPAVIEDINETDGVNVFVVVTDAEDTFDLAEIDANKNVVLVTNHPEYVENQAARKNVRVIGVDSF